MTKTLSLGKKDPDYIQHSLLAGAWQSVIQGIKRIGEGDVLKAGDMRQVGGEFLLEFDGSKEKVTWCHRMRNTRDHAEIDELKGVIGLDRPSHHNTEKSLPPQPQRRWTSSATGVLRRSMSAPRRASTFLAHPRKRSSSAGSHNHGFRRRSGSGSRRASVAAVDVPVRVVSLAALQTAATGQSNGHVGVPEKARVDETSYNKVKGTAEEKEPLSIGAQVIPEEPRTPKLTIEPSDESSTDEDDDGDSMNGTAVVKDAGKISVAEAKELRMIRYEELDSPTLGRDTMAGRVSIMAH